MLLHAEGDAVICIGQAAHSWVSGRLARCWGNARFAAPEPLAEVCLGAEQHDIGWSEWDRRPELDPGTGYPMSFLRVPRSTSQALWTDAPDRMLTQSPYAALLVSMHGTALGAGDPPTPEGRRYLSDQLALQADLIERIGESPDRARRNQQLVWVVDFLALVGLLPQWAPATQRTADGEVAVAIAAERRVTVDPWPFAPDEITVAYPGRRLTEPSATESELHARLAAAAWVDVPVTWSPA